MIVNNTDLVDCYELIPKVLEDSRGRFVKTFHQETFASLGLETNFVEEYYSVSSANVIRGLHFQNPPHDHAKCVTCLDGVIFDVVVDLRKNSSTYLKSFSIKLDSDIGNMLYVPRGFAHGFQVISEKAIFLSRLTSMYEPKSESGIHWNSLDIDWPIQNPIISDKDKHLQPLSTFKSPF